jgi:hypothetical protein
MKAKKNLVVAVVSLAFIGVLLGVISAWSSIIGPAFESMRQFTSLTALRSSFFLPSHSVESRAQIMVGPKDCFLNADGRPMVGWSDVRAQLGMPVRLAGYGVWSFWKAPFSAPSLRDDAADQIVGDMLVMHSVTGAWVLVTLDTLGVPAPAAARLGADIQAEALETLHASSPGGKSAAECVMVTIVASHSHSSPDLTGIWGGAADSWSSSRNQSNARDLIYKPLASALRESVRQSIAVSLPVRLTVDHDYYPTSSTAAATVATKDDLPKVLSHGANLTRIWIAHDGHESEKKAVVWIWNGHAATELRSAQSGKIEYGDFPSKIRGALGENLHSFFLPGVIAGDYPIEHEGWLGELITHVSQAPVQRPGTFSIGLRERNYCLEADNRLRAPLESWSVFGGGEGLAQCADSPSDSERSSFLARFQSVRIQVGKQNESELLELAFLPFETFADVETQLRHTMAHDLRIVSLANGFDGHGLAKHQFDSLMSGAPESHRAKPYHLFLAIRSNIDDVTNRFLGEDQR